MIVAISLCPFDFRHKWTSGKVNLGCFPGPWMSGSQYKGCTSTWNQSSVLPTFNGNLSASQKHYWIEAVNANCFYYNYIKEKRKQLLDWFFSGHCRVMLSYSLQLTNPGKTSWGELRTGGMPSKLPLPQEHWRRLPHVDRTWRKYRRA